MGGCRKFGGFRDFPFGLGLFDFGRIQEVLSLALETRHAY